MVKKRNGGKCRVSRLNPIQQQINPEERGSGVSILLLARNASIVATRREHGLQECQGAEKSPRKRAAQSVWALFKQGT